MPGRCRAGLMLLMALVLPPLAYGQRDITSTLSGRARSLENLAKGEGQIEILAIEQYFDDASKTYVFEGDVEVKQSGVFTLQAQKVLYFQAENWITADGQVSLHLGADVMTGSAATFNIETKRATIQNVHAVLAPSVIVEAASVEKMAPHPKTGADRYYVVDGTFTACNRPGTGWSLHANSALVHMDHFLHLYGVTFRAGSVPLMYLPYYAQSIKRERSTGFLAPRVGYDNVWGPFLNVEWFWAIADWIDMTFGVTPYGTTRLDGTGQLRFRLSPKDPINTIDATFTHLFDPELVPLLNESDILSVRTRLAHQFPEKINATVNGLIQTQQLRDDPNTDPRFRTAPFNRLDATVSRAWGSQNARILFSHVDSLQPGLAGESLTQKLPSFIYSSGSPWKLLGTALQFRIDTFSAENIRRREAFIVPDPNDPNTLDLTLWRVNFVPTIQSTLALPGISIQPSLSLVETYYSRRRELDTRLPVAGTFGTLPYNPLDPNQPLVLRDSSAGAFIGHAGDGLYRHLYRAGVNLTGPSFYRIYGGEAKEASKTKHLIQPTVRYNYSPFVDETEVVQTGEFNIDRAGTTAHQVTYGLSNSLLHKGPGASTPQEVFRFDAEQTYFFLTDEDLTQLVRFNPNARRLGDLKFNLQARASQRFASTVEIDLESDEWRPRRLSLDLSANERLWNVRAGYLRTATFRGIGEAALWTVDQHSVAFGGRARVFQHWSVGARGTYSLLLKVLDDSFLELGYGSQCWGVTAGLGVTERRLGQVETGLIDRNLSFSLTVNLRSLGSLGTTQTLN